MIETGDGAKMPEPLSLEEAFSEMAVEGTEIDEFDLTLADGLPNDDYPYEQKLVRRAVQDARRKHP